MSGARIKLKLERAIRALKSGGIIAYPTEAVFGLGCDPRNRVAVERLIRLKRRSSSKGLILIGASLAQFWPYIRTLGPSQQEQLQASWPGAVTWLVPARPEIAPWLRGDHNTLAIRVPGHKVARQLCSAWGSPIVSTSANISRYPAAREAYEIRRMFGFRVNYVLNESVGGAEKASQIKNLETGKVLRPG